MKIPDLDSTAVYYLVVFITVAILLVYIRAGDVIPLVGFLLTGALVFSLFPNKSVALVSGIVIASLLRMSKREGLEEGPGITPTETETKQVDTPDTVQPSVDASMANMASAVSTEGSLQLNNTTTSDPKEVKSTSYLESPPAPDFVAAPVRGSDPAPAAASDTVSTPSSVSEPPPATLKLSPDAGMAGASQGKGLPAFAKAAKSASSRSPTQEQFAALSPSEYTATDMAQLSNIIDKTTELLKMLPDGFLAKASL
jgi:hypothetical protein